MYYVLSQLLGTPPHTMYALCMDLNFLFIFLIILIFGRAREGQT
jgi:hypothetical protein